MNALTSITRASLLAFLFALSGCLSRADTLDPPVCESEISEAPETPAPPPCTEPACPRATQLALGDRFSCALLGDGTVKCWGDNLHGQLGDGCPHDLGQDCSRSSPVRVVGVSDIQQVAVSKVGQSIGGAACALTLSGDVYCWGDNWAGQTGDPATFQGGGASYGRNFVPVRVEGVSSAVEIAAARDEVCARLSDGSVRCWGLYCPNQDGSVSGDTLIISHEIHRVPTAVPGLPAVRRLALGETTECFQLEGGGVRCMGVGPEGQRGDGTYSVCRAPPVRALNLGEGVQQVAMGMNHGCARLCDGTVRCWGGDFADGTVQGARPVAHGYGATPIEITGLTDVVQLAANADRTCARHRDGTVSCWSVPFEEGEVAVPERLPNVSDVLEIALGRDHACGRFADGSLRCWGNNGDGQLGSGSRAASDAPVQVNLTDE